jgi:thioesterase domain-containing protein
VDGLLEPNTNYSVMAAEYISEIKKLQPQGPYYLGGFSLVVRLHLRWHNN